MPSVSDVAATLRVLDSGGTVAIRSSRTKATIAMVAIFLLGLALLALLLLIITRSAEEEVHWALSAFNLRIWALVVAVVACLAGPPWAMKRFAQRDESVVLSRDGIADRHGDDPTPRATVRWDEIREVGLWRPPSTHGRLSLGPRRVSYRLTPEAAQRRGRTGPDADLHVIWTMYEVPREQLAEILRAAHRRYGSRRGLPSGP